MELVSVGITESPRAEFREAITVKGFLDASFVDWSDKITSVLFLPGCNFRCPFCHNHSLVLNPDIYEDIPLGHILRRLTELKTWVDGVCITGGEPALYCHLPILIERIKELGFPVKLDTNGSRPDILRGLVERGLVDFVAMDVKAPLDEKSYSAATGVPVYLENIKESIDLLRRGSVKYQFRTTVVPALHREEDLLELARQLRGSSSLALQNFDSQDPLDQSLRGTSPYSEEWIAKMEERIVSILGQ